MNKEDIANGYFEGHMMYRRYIARSFVCFLLILCAVYPLYYMASNSSYNKNRTSKIFNKQVKKSTKGTSCHCEANNNFYSSELVIGIGIAACIVAGILLYQLYQFYSGVIGD